eukprot:8908590-Pyramimonas_sp.AAC.1
MPSTVLPGKFNEEVGFDYTFCKQEHHIFQIIDRCIRHATAMEIPDKTMASILGACRQCWMMFGPAKALCADGEGALNNDTAKALLK